MRNIAAKSGFLLAAACLALPIIIGTPDTGFAATSAECVRDYTALKKKSDVQRAKAKKQKQLANPAVAEIAGQLQVKAQECAKIARAEAENFMAKPFKSRFNYDTKTFSEVCELVGDSADIRCGVVPAYWQCVAAFKYSPKRCVRLNGKAALPCCHRKR